MKKNDYFSNAVRFRKAGINDFVVINDNLSDRNPVIIEDMKQTGNVKLPQFAIVCILQGSSDFDVNGSNYHVERGDVFSLVDIFSFVMRDVSQDLKFQTIEFYPMVVEEAKRTLGITQQIFNLEKDRVSMFHLDGAQIELCKKLHDYIFRWLIDKDNTYCKEIVQHMCNILILKLVEMTNKDDNHNVSQRKAVSRQNVIYENFIKLVGEHYSTNREVKFYAEKLNVTPKYLSAVTRIYTNKCASDNIELFVINKIKTLILEEKYSIKEICNLMNFSSQSFFGRYFKRNTGMSPKEFLRMYS